jgi:hypothetical protein
VILPTKKLAKLRPRYINSSRYLGKQRRNPQMRTMAMIPSNRSVELTITCTEMNQAETQQQQAHGIYSRLSLTRDLGYFTLRFLECCYFDTQDFESKSQLDSTLLTLTLLYFLYGVTYSGLIMSIL